MTLDEELRLSYYKPLAPLSEGHDVLLVQHTESGRVFVRKEMSVYDADVFLRLKETPVRGIPRIYEAVEDGCKLTVIEQYIDGVPLSSVLNKRGPLDEEEALTVAKQLAVILDRLHSMDPPVIHRDIKPSNVLLSEDGTVTLIDLNAAKEYDAGSTRDTELIGTAGFAAPEQYGFGSSRPETDIYSLGVLLSVMLGGNGGIPVNCSDKTASVIKRCTDIDPENRFKSALRLLTALNAAGSVRKRVEAGRASDPRFRPLGFRSLTPWKMILAVIGYAGIAWIVSLAGFETLSGFKLFLVHLGMFVSILIAMLFPSNFCGVLDRLKLSGIKPVWLRVVMIVLLDTALFMLIFIPFLLIK